MAIRTVRQLVAELQALEDQDQVVCYVYAVADQFGVHDLQTGERTWPTPSQFAHAVNELDQDDLFEDVLEKVDNEVQYTVTHNLDDQDA